MFSALKRLTNKDDAGKGAANNCVRPGVQAMSTSLQKKFSKGIHYNMKIIIRGDRSVGKTCLFLRLQGQVFREEYIPSDEITVASIQWNYKATDDVVKVEVWDVVDKGRKRRPAEGLKLVNASEVPEEPALDAEFLDVYKATNGVILVMDITKAWTLEYVQREMPKIPPHIPVLVLANHCDMSHHRTVTPEHVTFYIESLSRQAPVRYTEGSMRNGFGLRYMHKFFNLPFLQLQRETLLAQLTTNDNEMQITLQELDLFQEKDEANYNRFIDNLTDKRRQAAESIGVTGVPQPNNTQPPPIQLDNSGVKRSISMPGQISSETRISVPQRSSPKKETMNKHQLVRQDIEIGVTAEKIPFGKLDTTIKSVEEFVPDEDAIDTTFLEDTSALTNNAAQSARTELDSDSEHETNNPLVATFQDELDPDDLCIMPMSPLSQLSLSAPTSSLDSPPQDITPDWLLPDKAHRGSPEGQEGGESEPDCVGSSKQNTSMPLLAVDKETTKKKKSVKVKTSTDKKKEKTKKRKPKKERDELEEFLNGTGSAPIEDAYEAL